MIADVSQDAREDVLVHVKLDAMLNALQRVKEGAQSVALPDVHHLVNQDAPEHAIVVGDAHLVVDVAEVVRRVMDVQALVKGAMVVMDAMAVEVPVIGTVQALALDVMGVVNHVMPPVFMRVKQNLEHVMGVLLIVELRVKIPALEPIPEVKEVHIYGMWRM